MLHPVLSNQCVYALSGLRADLSDLLAQITLDVLPSFAVFIDSSLCDSIFMTHITDSAWQTVHEELFEAEERLRDLRFALRDKFACQTTSLPA